MPDDNSHLRPSPQGEDEPHPVASDREPEGALDFNDSVIADLVRREVRDCSGITGFAASFLDGLRTGRQRGISVTQGEEGITIELRVAVAYGTDCPALFEEVGRRVADKVQETTGRPASVVNMRVMEIQDRMQEEDPDLDDPYIDF